MSDCPTGCGRPRGRSKLACLQCWREIPEHLQRRVNRLFRVWWADQGDSERFQDYMEAREEALGSIR